MSQHEDWEDIRVRSHNPVSPVLETETALATWDTADNAHGEVREDDDDDDDDDERCALARQHHKFVQAELKVGEQHLKCG